MHASTLKSLLQVDTNSSDMLGRKDVGSCVLGTVGNLRFSAKQGGSARATRTGVMLSEIRRSVANLFTGLTRYVMRAPQSVRARSDALDQARANSRLIGNLLGSLTSPADSVMGWVRITQKLEQLAERSKGDLANLKGWHYCLETYVAELSNADLKAMRNGVLGNAFAREFLLCEDSGKHPGLATEMLNQIAQVLERRLAQTLQEPLEGIAEQLSAKSIDGEKLKGYLSSLYSSPAIAALDRYLPSLSEDKLTKLRTLMDKRKQLECYWVLLNAKPDRGRPQAMLKQFCGSMCALAQTPAQGDSLNLQGGSRPDGLLIQVADEEVQVRDFCEQPSLKARPQGVLSGLAEKKRVVDAYLDALARGDLKTLRADLAYAAKVARSLMI